MNNSIQLYKRKALYYETDQMGIIHHSNYIRWFEEARIDLMEQIGCGYKDMEESGIMSPVMSINCEYKSMVRFGDEIFIIPKVEEFKNGIKLVLSYKVMDAATKEVRTTGKSEHCFLNKNGRPISLKRESKKAYEAIESIVGIDFQDE
ncbi:acyl-CoA thioesterase [Clostridium sp. 19966]|uniref:acyl-CoA thioesterase n=1 Tax=Clostridium sp. 19966 TaxID=2768166 RepID=UPI0028DD6EEF|nr:thioesterase family protein [Clostridium sp. 19966]MDT8718719.1 acyl-CoA thioesterase [Clostridium sp. 19966]